MSSFRPPLGPFPLSNTPSPYARETQRRRTLRALSSSDSSAELSSLDALPEPLTINIFDLVPMVDPRGGSLAGSFNKPYRFSYEGSDWVVKIPLKITDPIMAELSAPARAVRVMHEIHSELMAQEVRIVTEEGEIAAWMMLYVEGRQSTDLEIRNKLKEIYKDTGRIIPDFMCDENFLTTKEGQVFCIDVDLALNLSTDSRDGDRPFSPASFEAWVPGRSIYNLFQSRVNGARDSLAYQGSLRFCQSLLEFNEECSGQVSPQSIYSLRGAVKALWRALLPQIKSCLSDQDVYIGARIRSVFGLGVSKKEAIALNDSVDEAMRLEDFPDLIDRLEAVIRVLGERPSTPVQALLRDVKEKLRVAEMQNRSVSVSDVCVDLPDSRAPSRSQGIVSLFSSAMGAGSALASRASSAMGGALDALAFLKPITRGFTPLSATPTELTSGSPNPGLPSSSSEKTFKPLTSEMKQES